MDKELKLIQTGHDLKVDSLMVKSNTERWFLRTETCMKVNTTTTVLQVKEFTNGQMEENTMECGTKT